MRRHASAEAICNSRWLFHLTVDLWRSPPDMSNDAVDGVDLGEHPRATTVGQGYHVVRHELQVDPSEGDAALIDLVRQCDEFDVRMERLPVGDYCLDRGIVVTSGRRMRISPSHLQTDVCSLKPHSSRDALIALSFSSRGRGRRACRIFIHMRSKVRWCRWLSCGGFPCSARAIRKTRSEFSAFLHTSSARRIMVFCNGTAGSRSVWRRASSTCCRVSPAWVRHWRIGCYSSSVPS